MNQMLNKYIYIKWKAQMLYLLKWILKQVISGHCNFNMAWQGIGGTEVSELTQFPAETSLIL